MSEPTQQEINERLVESILRLEERVAALEARITNLENRTEP